MIFCQFNYTDSLKAQIYEDFLQSIASVHAGESSETAFREHEKRVHGIRMKIAAAEVRPVELRLVG